MLDHKLAALLGQSLLSHESAAMIVQQAWAVLLTMSINSVWGSIYIMFSWY